MKKIFILLALFAVPSLAMGQNSMLGVDRTEAPESRMMQHLQIEAQALSKSATTLDKTFLNLSSISKYNDMLQEAYPGTEIIVDQTSPSYITDGQGTEMGPQTNYSIDYDPFSNLIVGISTARYYAYEEDGITIRPNYHRNVNYLNMTVFEPNKILTIRRNSFVDTTWRTPSANLPAELDVYAWRTPSIVVTNAEESTDINHAKIAISLQTNMTPRNDSLATPKYNTIYALNYSIFSTATNLEEFRAGISYDYVENPWFNPVTNYTFARPLKGHKAYFKENGSSKNIPFSIFFSPIFHNTAPRSNNRLRFGILSLRMDKVPTQGAQSLDNITHKFQFLPEEIEDLLGDGIIVSSTTNSSGSALSSETDRGFNIDYDDQNNLYIGMLEKQKAFVDDPMTTTGYKRLPFPMVIKAKYDISTLPADGSAYEEMITDFSTNIMPYTDLVKFINSTELIAEREVTKDGATIIITDTLVGVVDSTNENIRPSFGIWAESSHQDLPFIVTGEDSYTFITPLLFYQRSKYDGRDFFERTLVSISYNPTDKWKIEQITDVNQYLISEIMPSAADEGMIFPFGDISTGVYATYTGLSRPTISGIAQGSILGLGAQISRTANNEYIIAKWQHATETDKIGLSEPLNIWDWSDVPVPTTLDSLYVPSLYLSYKKIGDANAKWSEPIRASYLNYPKEGPSGFDPLRDTMVIMGSYMPRIVPDIDHVLMSIARFDDQSTLGGVSGTIQASFKDKIAKHFTYNYAEHFLIAPSARTGPNPVGIQEGEEAINNSLEVAFPNPAFNSVNFKFSLLKPGKTTLDVFNALGEKVATVVNQYCNARDYSIEHNVSNLPVGTYYFVLTSGDVRQTKMFTIAR